MKKRVFIIFSILILIGVITTGTLSLSLIKNNYINNIEERMISNSKLISTFLQNTPNENIYLDKIAKTYSKEIDSRITIINNNGDVIGDSHADLEELTNHLNRPEIKKAIDDQIGISERYSNSIGAKMYYVAIPFYKENLDVAVIRLSLPLEYINEYTKKIYINIIISALTGLFIAMILAIRYINRITYPIEEFTKATKNISKGNYGEKIRFKSDDELGILAESFNIMSIELSQKIEELKNSNTNLRAILKSMSNGIIALDNNNNIMYTNPSAEKMFSIKNDKIKGKSLFVIIENAKLNKYIENLFEENSEKIIEIEINHPLTNILKVYTNPIIYKDNPSRKMGTLIILEDITEMRKLETMRKDFVANVSHELRTPLTSIKGFVETLKSGAVNDENTRDKFLNIIDEETSRLNTLIEDLSILTDIENRQNKIKKEKINPNETIEEVIEFLYELADNKNISIINKSNENLPYIYGNNGWLKQMLINLIENSIKYTKNNGKIIVTAYSNKSELIFKIKDNGIGIEKEYIDRVFERFFRVDKSRTKKIVGTGLGLAIVKHIVIQFNGKIKINSKKNEGTEFKITLPLQKK
ncbi:MAG: two-component system histidine kinase PnpS [Senegalia sp. (in: firmicutes)]|uniref:two-component system histidine kinase PnpS n=1 Tax=Senegalia sp. (in: firmicutes) TaxID=1924098 RepID=UPI003F99645F